MIGEPWHYAAGFASNVVTIFLQVYFIILYSDLECDFINPIDMCKKLNVYIVPEAVAQAIPTVLFLLGGYWFSFLLNLPIFAINVRKFYTTSYHLDATDIFRTLSKKKMEAFAKVLAYLALFFFNLYCMIRELVREE